MLGLKKNGKPQEVSLTISTQTYLRMAALIVATIILIGALQKASHAIVLIFTAFFLALALNSPVNWVGKRLPGKKKGSRVLATSFSYIVVVILIGTFIASIATPLVRQSENFIKAAPGLVQDFRSQDSDVGKLIRRYNLEKQVDNLSKQLSDRLDNIGGTAFSTFQKTTGSFFALLTILVLTFMMLVEGPRWIRFARRLIPDEKHEMADRLTRDMYSVIKGFVNGQVLLAAVAALFITPVLLVLGISYPIALVVIVFICGLIPMVGHTIGAIIVTTVALFGSFTSAIIVLAYYILYQQIENIFVQPRVQANTTNMSPLLVFASVVVGVSFGGLLGGLVAIPVAGCLRIALLEYLRSRKIIDEQVYKKTVTNTGETK